MFSSTAIPVGGRNLVKRHLATISLLSISVASGYGGVIYSTGFEGAQFVVGNNINGVDGWGEFNPTDSFDATQSTFVKTGLKAAWIIPVRTSTVQTGMYHSDSTTGPLIELSADIYLGSGTLQNEWQFAGLGGPGLAPFIGGIDVFADNSIHLITAGFASVGTFSRNVYNNVDFIFNMTTQKYSFALNGVTVATGVAFCGDNGPCTSGIPVTSYGNSFFDVFATLNSNDLGAIDNFSLSTINATPEPGSILLIASGLGLLVAKSRLASRKR